MKRVGAVLLVCGVVAACSGSDGSDADTTDTGVESTAPAPAVDGDSTTDDVAPDEVDDEAVAGAAGPVQDMWMLMALEMVRRDGSTVDVLPALTSLATAGADDSAVAVSSGTVYRRSEDLAASLLTVDGSPRGDVDMVGGLIETDSATMVAFIATPRQGGRWPDTEDVVSFELPEIEGLAPGLPLVADYQFVQILPDPAIDQLGTDGTIDDPLEFAAERLRAGSYQYATVGSDPDGPSVMFTDQLGQVRSSPLVGIRARQSGNAFGDVPAKAQPYFDGFGGGLKKCLTRPGSGTACVRKVLQGQAGGFGNAFGGMWDPNEPPSNEPNDGGEGQCAFDSCVPFGFPVPGWLCEATLGCGMAVADPHMRTFDRQRYDLQLVGEFVLARSPDVEVQIRTQPFGSSRLVSVVTYAAIKVDGHVIEVPADPSSPILIDGTTIDDRPPRSEAFVIGDVVVDWWMSTVDVVRGGVPVVRLSRSPSSLTVFVDPSASDGGWTGLLGDADGLIEDDLVGRDGVIADPDGDNLYEAFADTWRLTDDESIITYAPGESTATYTDLTFPDRQITVDDLSAADRAFATIVCTRAGITESSIHDDCVLDLALTGDLSMVRSAQGAQASLLNSQVADPSVFDSFVDSDAVVLANDRLIPAFHGFELATGGGLALLQTADAEGTTLSAIDLETGMARWRADGVDPRCRPVVVDGVGVAAQSPYGADGTDSAPVVLLSFEDGQELARSEAQSNGCDSSLSASGSIVFQTDINSIQAFDASADLERVWTLDFDNGTTVYQWAPVVQGHVLLLTSEPDGLRLHSLDPETGQEIASIDVTGGTMRTLDVLDEERVVVAANTAGESPRAATVVAVASDGELIDSWHRDYLDDGDLPWPRRFVALDDLVVGWANGTPGSPLVAYEADTGDVAWTFDESTFPNGDGSVIAIDDNSSIATVPALGNWIEMMDRSGMVTQVVRSAPRASFLPPSQLTALDDHRLIAVGEFPGGVYVRILDLG